jgi:hypothetical protein
MSEKNNQYFETAIIGSGIVGDIAFSQIERINKISNKDFNFAFIKTSSVVNLTEIVRFTTDEVLKICQHTQSEQTNDVGEIFIEDQIFKI